jgi:hypothetical protein
MAVRGVSGAESSYLQLPPIFTIVVKIKEFQIETRFLVACDYFHNLQKSGMKESVTSRITLDDFSEETVQTFLSFLKSYKLPMFDINQLIDFFKLIQFFQHTALLDQTRDLLIQEIPKELKKILQLADLYSDPRLKLECKDQVVKSPHQYVSLLSELIEEESYALVKEIQTWPSEVIRPMLTNSRRSENFKPVEMLMKNLQGDLAFELLKTAYRIGLKTIDVFPTADGALIGALVGSVGIEKDPLTAVETYEPIIADDPMILLRAVPALKMSPIFFVITQEGLSATFQKMIRLLNRSDVAASLISIEDSNATLLSICAALGRVQYIRALKNHPIQQKVSQSQFAQAVECAIEIKNLSVVREILSFPIEGSSSPGSVSVHSIHKAMSLETLDILKAIWPYYKATDAELVELKKRSYTENRLDWAEIFFNKNFDASKERRPNGKVGAWIYEVVMDGKPDWVEFMADRCTDKNVTVSFKVGQVSIPETPLVYALCYIKEEKILPLMIELGFDPNVSCGDLHPVHLVLKRKYSFDTVKKVIAPVKNITVLNDQKQSFLHLFFKAGFTFAQLHSLDHPALTPANLEKLLFLEDKDKNTPMHLALSNTIPALSEAPSKDDPLILLTLVLVDAPSDFLWKKNEKEAAPLKMIGSLEKGISTIIDATQAIERLFPDLSAKVNSFRRHLIFWCAQEYLYSLCARLLPITEEIERMRNSEGKSLLHLAANANVPLAVEKLIERGVPVDSTDKRGKTPLHYAVEKKDVAMVRKLLALEADPKKTDLSGETPLSYALKNYPSPRKSDEQEIVEALEVETCKIM